jgi:hypothetical protein
LEGSDRELLKLQSQQSPQVLRKLRKAPITVSSSRTDFQAVCFRKSVELYRSGEQIHKKFALKGQKSYSKLSLLHCLKKTFSHSFAVKESSDSSVGMALGCGLDDRGSRFRFPAGAGNFSLHHRVQNGFGTHPASYPMGTGGSFCGDKATGA